MNLKKYLKERDEALLSLDKEKIVKFMKKHCPDAEIPENETVFWAGVHKVICHLNSANAGQKLNSMIWLVNHGFQFEINNYGNR